MTGSQQEDREQAVDVNDLRQLLQRVRDGSLIVRKDRVYYANAAAEAIAPGGSWSDASFMGAVHPDDRGEVERALQQAEQGTSTGMLDVRMATGPDSWRDMLMSVSPMRHQGLPSAQVTLQDVGLHR